MYSSYVSLEVTPHVGTEGTVMARERFLPRVYPDVVNNISPMVG